MPMRPILSTCGSFNYNMSKYLVSVLSELCSNEFSVSDSFEFARDISLMENRDYYMASFDIKSLFTNIPVAETCQIILDKLFPHHNSTHNGFDKMQFERMLNNCLQNNIFLFNGNVYEQVDGCPMGGCISPTMANIFLCHYEKIWIDQCPVEFKPVLYKRYVDDSFLLFRHKSHVEKFHQYINSKHGRIKFTVENERDNILPFLDIKITKLPDGFETGTYRKPTHTGLGMKANSAVSNTYKRGLVKCLLDRATKINSTRTGLCREIQHLKKFFCQNGFGLKWVQKLINERMDSLARSSEPITTVPKKDIFCKFPFMSNHHNELLKRNLNSLIAQFYPQVNLRMVFQNNHTISSMFRFKDVIPKDLRSNIVYKYTCGVCNSAYIGETTRHFRTRVAEHMGISPRTGKPVKNPKSNIFKHHKDLGHALLESNFSIIGSTGVFDTKVLESIQIHAQKPSLNGMTASIPLNILG